MGKLEQENRTRTKRRNVQKAVLSAVAAAGILAAALVAPNVIGVFGKHGLIPRKRVRESILRARSRLVERGFLAYDGRHLKLTKRGEAELRRLELAAYNRRKPARWDKKWRVVIFDIPEKRRYMRAKVRNTLTAIGFVQLQRSVWLYPYDCEDLMTLLKADFKIGKDVLYLIVDALEYDARFRAHFGL